MIIKKRFKNFKVIYNTVITDSEISSGRAIDDKRNKASSVLCRN